MTKLPVILFLTLASLPAFGQGQIVLEDSDIQLLDLEFAPVAVAERQLGVSLPGVVVSPPNASNLGISLYPGVLEKWHATPGESVEAGALLATIRSMEVMEVQQNYQIANTEFLLAQQQVDRDGQLFDAGIISRRRLLESESRLDAAQSVLRTLDRQLVALGLAESDLQALLTGEFDLGTFTIRAPAAATLSHRAFLIGEHVPANAVVAELSGSDKPWLSVQVPARLIPLLEVGGSMSTAGTAYPLTLQQRDFNIDVLSQSVELLAEFDEQVPLIPGQLQTVILHPRPGAILIPASAVVHEGVESLVYVRNSSGVEIRPLSLIPMGDAYLASSGIRAGEAVLVKGAALVKGIQLGLGSDE